LLFEILREVLQPLSHDGLATEVSYQESRLYGLQERLSRLVLDPPILSSARMPNWCIAR
jgi:hypothetical protein